MAPFLLVMEAKPRRYKGARIESTVPYSGIVLVGSTSVGGDSCCLSTLAPGVECSLARNASEGHRPRIMVLAGGGVGH